ncbi:hypothetical protein [Absidia glauca]|uniref:F-box domain-containing protein n=1 Tax=Absidia glauca TaxID=4829 RepID=A0A168NXW8_ABSGL|nr:hypothetical protein [Absidia glauca]
MPSEQQECIGYGSNKTSSTSSTPSHLTPTQLPGTHHDVVMTEAAPLHHYQHTLMPHHPQRFLLGHGGVSGSHSLGFRATTRSIKKRNHGASSLGRNSPALQASKVAFYVAPRRHQRQRHPNQQPHQLYQYLPTIAHNQHQLSAGEELLFGTKKIDFLLELPCELSIQILSYLDTQSLVRLSSVSRGINELYRSNDVYVWRHRVYEQQWQPSLQRHLPMNWLHIFKQRYQLAKRWDNGKVSTRYLTGHRDSVYCLQFDDTKIITGSRDHTIKIWDMSSYQCVQTLHGHRASVLCLQFNDKIMVSGSSDMTLIIWDMATLRPVKTLQGHTAGVLDVSFDDRYIVSSSKDATIRIWDVTTGDLLRTIHAHNGPVNAIQLHGDNIVSASGDTLVKMWNVKTGACIRQFAGHTRGLACVQYDGKRIITGSNDRTIRVFDAETGECTMIFEGHTDLVRTLHFNGDRIVSASYDLSVRVWDIKSGACLLNFQSGHTSWVLDVHFDKTKIISASQDHRVLVMDFAQGLDTKYL